MNKELNTDLPGDFAFIIHPLSISDVARKYRFTKNLPEGLVERAIRFLPPVKTSEITGVRSLTGAELSGWFVGCPLTPEQMVSLPEEFVMKRIIQSARLAEKLGAKVVGLGAFTSVVGDAGITVAKNVGIAVTTGNTYTVATALEGVEYACRRVGIDMSKATALVIGATGSIGKASAKLLRPKVRRLLLAGRDHNRLQKVAADILAAAPGRQDRIEVLTDVSQALRQADIVVTVTSAVDTIIQAQDLRPGAVVCDVARPRDVSRQVAEERQDVLVFEGGVVEVPGEVRFGLDFGFPPGTSYACMAETMILALEKRFENFSLGRDLDVAKVQEISALAAKHGFRLAGLRSFERAVPEEAFARVKAAGDAYREQLALHGQAQYA